MTVPGLTQIYRECHIWLYNLINNYRKEAQVELYLHSVKLQVSLYHEKESKTMIMIGSQNGSKQWWVSFHHNVNPTKYSFSLFFIKKTLSSLSSVDMVPLVFNVLYKIDSCLCKMLEIQAYYILIAYYMLHILHKFSRWLGIVQSNGTCMREILSDDVLYILRSS